MDKVINLKLEKKQLKINARSVALDTLLKIFKQKLSKKRKKNATKQDKIV